MFASVQQPATALSLLRKECVREYEEVFASKWQSRLEQLRCAEEAICDGTMAPDREIEQLIAQKPTNMRGLWFDSLFGSPMLFNLNFSWQIEGQQDHQRVPKAVEPQAAGAHAALRRYLAKERVPNSDGAKRDRHSKLERRY